MGGIADLELQPYDFPIILTQQKRICPNSKSSKSGVSQSSFLRDETLKKIFQPSRSRKLAGRFPPNFQGLWRAAKNLDRRLVRGSIPGRGGSLWLNGPLIFCAYIEYYLQTQNYVAGGKTRSRGYILNLRTTVNNSETAIAMGFKFSTHTFYEDYNLQIQN